MSGARIYRMLLALYPIEFAERHGDEMLLDFGDLSTQYERRRLQFVGRILRDFTVSLVREHIRMIFDGGLRRVFLIQGFLLTALVSALALMTYVVGQQVLRHDANDPQVQMASDTAADIAGGATPQSVVPARAIDVAQSLAPFVIVYDDSGRVLASSGSLHGTAPKPPMGVFNGARARGSAVLTWQPEPGVRIASVTTRYGGARPGFVLAGRSLRLVEERSSTLFKLVACLWAALMLLMMIGTFALLRFCPAQVVRAS